MSLGFSFKTVYFIEILKLSFLGQNSECRCALNPIK